MAKRTKKVEVTLQTQEPKTLWQRIKDKVYNSGTIIGAWVKGIIGTSIAAVMGVLASTDFSSIFNMLKSGATFRKEQLMVMGIGAVAIGFTDYWVRVRGTKVVDSHLLPKA